MKLHKVICYVLWGLWGIGLCLTSVSRFGLQNESEMFWKLMATYNQFVQVVSFVPVQPVFFVLDMLYRKAHGQPYYPAVVLLCSTFILWVTYISLFVRWTGGV